MNFFEIIYIACCEILGGNNAVISKSKNIYFLVAYTDTLYFHLPLYLRNHCTVCVRITKKRFLKISQLILINFGLRKIFPFLQNGNFWRPSNVQSFLVDPFILRYFKNYSIPNFEEKKSDGERKAQTPCVLERIFFFCISCIFERNRKKPGSKNLSIE